MKYDMIPAYRKATRFVIIVYFHRVCRWKQFLKVYTTTKSYKILIEKLKNLTGLTALRFIAKTLMGSSLPEVFITLYFKFESFSYIATAMPYYRSGLCIFIYTVAVIVCILRCILQLS